MRTGLVIEMMRGVRGMLGEYTGRSAYIMRISGDGRWM